MATAYVQRVDQYYSEVCVSTTDAAGTIGRIGFDPGFLATSLAFWNDKASTVYVTVQSTTGSTGGFRLASGESITLQCRTGGFALASTTTSTGDTVRVLAIGG